MPPKKKLKKPEGQSCINAYLKSRALGSETVDLTCGDEMTVAMPSPATPGREKVTDSNDTPKSTVGMPPLSDRGKEDVDETPKSTVAMPPPSTPDKKDVDETPKSTVAMPPPSTPGKKDVDETPKSTVAMPPPSTPGKKDVTSSKEETPQKSTPKRKIRDTWFKLWPWMFEKEGAMFCNLCVNAKQKNVFATTGCRVYKTTSLSRHEKSDEHLSTEKTPQLSSAFTKAVDNSMSKQDASILKCISTVVWLAKENVAMSKFEKMFELFRELDVPGLEPLQLNERTSYGSYYTGQEILDAVSSVIDEDVNKKLSASPFITMFADESTDLANKKRITINARIIDSTTCTPETVFLSDKEYEDGTGIGLATVIVQELEKRGQSIDKLIGFGSDGAAVMTGANKGVKGILMQKQPHLIHIHCMAHRLALCTSQAANAVKQVKLYQEWLTSLYYYFSKSASREQDLHKLQMVLESPALKYKEVHAVRWLSVYQAVEAVYRTIEPLLAFLHQRNMSKDPKSKGLLKKMATTEFVFITYMLMDTLAIVSKLCLIFQEQNLDIASAKLAVDGCLADLEAYKNGEQLFPTHLEHYNEDVVSNDGQHTFKNSGHVLSTTPTNLNGVKSAFVNGVTTNIKSRFPQKDLVDAFFVLGMRGINMGNDDFAKGYGNEEIRRITDHFGEEKVYKGTVGLPKVEKAAVLEQWGRAKLIVRSMHYVTDDILELWQLLSKHHSEELSQLLRIAQIGLILPLHTADCERTFSQQNKILTKSRARLSTKQLDALIRVRLYTKGGQEVDKHRVLAKWKATKARKLYCVK